MNLLSCPTFSVHFKNPDFADEINIYQEEIKNQEVYLNEEVTQVIQAMNELTNKLLEY